MRHEKKLMEGAEEVRVGRKRVDKTEVFIHEESMTLQTINPRIEVSNPDLATERLKEAQVV